MGAVGIWLWGLWGGVLFGRTGILGGQDEGGNCGMGRNCNVLARKIVNANGDNILAGQSYRAGQHMRLISLHPGPNHFSLNLIGELDFGGNVCQTNNLCVGRDSQVVTGCQGKLPMENNPIFI